MSAFTDRGKAVFLKSFPVLELAEFDREGSHLLRRKRHKVNANSTSFQSQD